jgi:hypothetical protein
MKMTRWMTLLLWACTSIAQANEPSVPPLQHVVGYRYAKADLQALLANPAVRDFHLELAWEKTDALRAWIVAVDDQFQPVGVVDATRVDAPIDLAQMAALPPLSPQDISAQGPVLAAHIIQPQTAATYIGDWIALRQSGAPLAPRMSYPPDAIELFVLERAVVENVAEHPQSAEVAVFWGLNTDEKLTPVLLGIDAGGAVVIGETAAAGLALDVTTPCPPFGWSHLNGKERTPRPRPRP